LRIQDKDGKTKFVLRDEDEEPVSIDELIIKDMTLQAAEEEKQNGNPSGN
jgi:hypothetical protein